MNFSNRLKKELTEGVIRAVLHDAGYRLIDSGIESIIRELTCLNQEDYINLDFPKSMRTLPDFVVMDREQENKYLVEVKYRAEWNNEIFRDIEEQVKLHKNLVLIFFSGTPEKTKEEDETGPSSYIRSCKVRWHNDNIEAFIEKGKDTGYKWMSITEFNGKSWEWFSMEKIQDTFPLLKESKENDTLLTVIESLSGILISQT